MVSGRSYINTYSRAKRVCETPEKWVVIDAHGHSQLEKSQRCVASLSGRNRTSYGGRNRVTEGRGLGPKTLKLCPAICLPFGLLDFCPFIHPWLYQ
ncbi:hypothetical protein EVAR_24656_1 [Eumeta japonica]|uniref:Uncharacterized protein n=1 Tax=Eumeta variegata TaxID=151549 RepID=A0A4C1V2G9_EUMVA|nr:hypothetical protein EVAR_24656_1 [Eumeta japonica]